jgi:tRNA nucleotidyltransferase (CCA-adding enzyme)
MMLAPLKFKIPPKTLSLLKRIGQLAAERGEAAYAVGGFVRDLFLKHTGVDIDITVEGDGITFAEKLAHLTGSEVEAFSRFGTSIVVIPGFGKIDVTTARTESYERPGALPQVKKAGIVQDLYRRDFTLNAMALSLSPGYFLKLLDPFGGLEDLRKKRIRALHEKSFMDDPTRIFRAVRFEQRFQEQIEPHTQKWLLAAVRGDYVRRVSGERLRSELRLIFQEPRPEKAVWRLNELGALPYIHPALTLTKESKQILPKVGRAIQSFYEKKLSLEEEKMVWFQCLLLKADEKEAGAISKRLMLSRIEQNIVRQSKKAYPSVLQELADGSLPVSRIHRLLCPLRAEVLCFLFAAATSALRKRLSQYLDRIQKAVPWVRGRDLKALGIPPGFRYSFILLEALNGQLDGKFKNRHAAISWVKKNFVL